MKRVRKTIWNKKRKKEEEVKEEWKYIDHLLFPSSPSPSFFIHKRRVTSYRFKSKKEVIDYAEHYVNQKIIKEVRKPLTVLLRKYQNSLYLLGWIAEEASRHKPINKTVNISHPVFLKSLIVRKLDYIEEEKECFSSSYLLSCLTEFYFSLSLRFPSLHLSKEQLFSTAEKYEMKITEKDIEYHGLLWTVDNSNNYTWHNEGAFLILSAFSLLEISSISYRKRLLLFS